MQVLKNISGGWTNIQLLLFALLVGHFSSCQRGGIPLTTLANWDIIVSPQAIPSEQYAAEEFQFLFSQATGYRLTITREIKNDSHHIFIGHSSEMEASSVGFSIADFGAEELCIRTDSDNIAIAGGQPRGTLYGVYEFFERYIGVRFLTKDHTFFPENLSDISIPSANYRFKPVFNFRWSYYGENKFNQEFAVRLRNNTLAASEKLGGMTSQHLINHSLRRQLSVEKYGAKYPEYFALVRGERKISMWGGGPEPCVSNPDVIKIVTQAVLEEIGNNPDRANVSVSQNDNAAYCRCENCEAINKTEGSPMGAHLAFVNKIAEEVEKRFPQVMVGTLSYWYTRKPPKNIKPRKNVQIQFADIESCRLHRLDDPNCPKNKPIMAEIDDWSKITNQLYIWTYATDFRYYDLPFPNLRAVGANISLFAEKGVKGVFVQAHGGSITGDFSDLRNYIISRCLWDPRRDGWEELKEFCKLHYGNAAPVILAYLNLIHDSAEEKGIHPGCFASPKELGLTPDYVSQIYDYFQKAMSTAENDIVRDRVEKVSIAAYRSVLEAGVAFSFSDGRLRKPYQKKYGNIVETYIKLAKKHNLTMPDERKRFADFEEMLREKYSAGIPVAQIENDYWRISAMYKDNGKVVELLYKPTNRNLVSALKNNLMFGSFDEWLEKDPDHNAAQPAFVVQVDKNSMMLHRNLPSGADYIRKISLPSDSSKKIICQSSIKHNSSSTHTYQLIVHPEFDAATSTNDYNLLSGYVFHNDKWVIFNKNLVNDEGPDSHLLIDAKDGGKYAFYNHDSAFGVMETYDPRYIAKLRTWWVPEFELFNLELETIPVKLSRGESITLNYAFEYLNKPPE